MIFLLALALFVPLGETIPEKPFAYKGMHPREIITVDPDNTPFLDAAYHALESAFHKGNTEEEILHATCFYVRNTLFDISICTRVNVQGWIQNLYAGEDQPEIPLECFLKNRVGVCRHIALTTTYLIHRLIQTGWLKGEVFLIRENIFFGRHAWTLFLSNKSAWHLDPFWAVIEDGKTENGWNNLCKLYGQHVMEKQQKRWEYFD